MSRWNLERPGFNAARFLHHPNSDEWMKRATKRVRTRLKKPASQPASDHQGIGRAIHRSLSDLSWSTMQRRPIILPVVMEV